MQLFQYITPIKKWNSVAACQVTVLVLSFARIGSAVESEPAAAKDIGAVAKPAIGDKLSGIAFKDTRYLKRTLGDLSHAKDPVAKRGFVLVFTNTTCPLVQKYWPCLKNLDRQLRDQGIQVVSVNVGARDSIVEMAAQAVTHELEFPVVQDIDGSTVRACGVERTPEVVLIDADHKLRYRGRIDDQYRLGGALPTATKYELRDAIESLLANREIAVTEAPVDGCRITFPQASKPASDISFDQVAHLFEKHCQSCHRDGTAAPFALTSYEEISANAAMIAEVVADRRMPPWYASSEFGEFVNCSRLPEEDRRLILDWVRAGAANVDHETAEKSAAAVAADSADPKEHTWLAGEPDLVLSCPGEYSIPADGYVDYKYAILHHVFLQDTWIQGAEILPDNPRVVHHCNLGFATMGRGIRNARLVTGFTPGGGPLELKEGIAVRIPAGSVLGLQIHLSTTGKPEKCKLNVGLRFAREVVQKELRYVQINVDSFTIPPFAPSHPIVESRTVDRDVSMIGMFAHMHVRGKDITFRAFAPDAEPQTLLMIPNYSFDWQMPYVVPPGKQKFPAGTRFECVAHFDNSTFNPYNPDPTATVTEGQQTFNEMMYGYVFYTADGEQLNLRVDPKSGRAIAD